MTKHHLIMAMMLLVCGLCLVASAQEEFDADPLDDDPDVVEFRYKPNPNRIRLKSTITEALAQQLKAGQPISIRIPAGAPQIISSLVVRKPEYYKAKLLSIRPRTQVADGTLTIPIPIQVIDRLDYQPVELQIYQSNVVRATLVPINDTENNYSLITKAIQPDFFVRLKPNKGVAVAFENVKSFKLKNELFDVEFPFLEIEGIFFGDQEEKMASVVLRNGDMVSGKHSWPEKVEFDTRWGKEEIELDQVVAVTRDKSVQLVPSGVENPKFILLRESNRYIPGR